MLVTREKAFSAVRWFKNGDHPLDGNERFTDGEFKGELLEGKVVRYYRHPLIDGSYICKSCGHIMHEHGWIDDGDQVVCPGDWVITKETHTYFVLTDKIVSLLLKPIE